MINTIEVIIRSGIFDSIHLIISYPRESCYMNNKIYTLNDKFLDELVRTIRLWDNEYGYDQMIDSEEFKVIVTTNEKEEIFHGKGIFPSNYQGFKRLLGEIHD